MRRVNYLNIYPGKIESPYRLNSYYLQAAGIFKAQLLSTIPSEIKKDFPKALLWHHRPMSEHRPLPDEFYEEMSEILEIDLKNDPEAVSKLNELNIFHPDNNKFWEDIDNRPRKKDRVEAMQYIHDLVSKLYFALTVVDYPVTLDLITDDFSALRLGRVIGDVEELEHHLSEALQKLKKKHPSYGRRRMTLKRVIRMCDRIFSVCHKKTCSPKKLAQSKKDFILAALNYLEFTPPQGSKRWLPKHYSLIKKMLIREYGGRAAGTAS